MSAASEETERVLPTIWRHGCRRHRCGMSDYEERAVL